MLGQKAQVGDYEVGTYLEMKSLDIQGKTILLDEEDFIKFKSFNWKLTSDGRYAQRRIYENGGERWVAMHRIIMQAKPGQIVDHINCNTFDNRKENLRFVTPKQNARNRPKRKNCSSRFKGVYKKGNKWCASIFLDGDKHYLGSFDKEEDARDAYERMALEFFGDFKYCYQG